MLCAFIHLSYLLTYLLAHLVSFREQQGPYITFNISNILKVSRRDVNLVLSTRQLCHSCHRNINRCSPKIQDRLFSLLWHLLCKVSIYTFPFTTPVPIRSSSPKFKHKIQYRNVTGINYEFIILNYLSVCTASPALMHLTIDLPKYKYVNWSGDQLQDHNHQRIHATSLCMQCSPS